MDLMTEQKLYRKCADCGGDFYITEKDQKFFEARQLALPKRCWSCRQKNKAQAEKALAEQGISLGPHEQDTWENVWKPEDQPPAPDRKPKRSPVRPAERRGRKT